MLLCLLNLKTSANTTRWAIRNCGFGPYLFSDWAGRILCHCWPSGAGKTTVLNMLGGMDSCDSGKMLVDGVDISTLSEKELTDYRRYDVGFVFQFYNLVQNLTALEMWSWLPRFVRIRWILKGRLRRWDYRSACIIFPAQLSGGEQQRVSIARAIAKNPKILLCDEPTGALDYHTGKTILKLLQDCCRETGKTVIVITHNQALTAMADRVIHIRNGQVSKMELNENPTSVEEIEW